MTTTTQPMTAEELLNMPDDGFRYELIRGELRRYELNGHEQGRIAANAAVALGVYMKDSGLGGSCVAGTGFHLESHPDHVRAPHVAFVRRERAEAVGDVPGFFPGAPDLAIEVISPSDRYTGGGGEGRGLANRRNARGDRRGSAQADSKGASLAYGRRRTDGTGRAGRRRRRARMAMPVSDMFR